MSGAAGPASSRLARTRSMGADPHVLLDLLADTA